MGLEERPNLAAMANDIDFLLVNSHPVLDHSVPQGPNTAMVGGIHLTTPKPVQGKLREFLDGANEGVVVVSFGTVSLSL